MSKDIQEVTSFGDVRRLIIETIIGIREGSLGPMQGAAMAANFKELNNNINAEINAAKMAVITEGKAHEFGKVMRLGTQYIADNRTDPDIE